MHTELRRDAIIQIGCAPILAYYLALSSGLHDVWERQNPAKHFAPEFRVPECQQWSRKFQGEYIQPDYKKQLFQLCEDIRVAQSTDRAGLPMLRIDAEAKRG